MNNMNTSNNTRKRSLNLGLFLSGLTLSIRSRQGFNALMAWSRFIGVMIVCIRFFISSKEITPSTEITILSIGLLGSFVIALYSNKIIQRYDRPAFHTLVIFADTLMICYFIFITGYAATEIYLFFFLPLVTASHFVERKKLFFIGNIVVFLYLADLFLMSRGIPLSEVIVPWFGKATFLMIGTLVFRAQRSLPNTNELWVVAPAKAREKLENLLSDIQSTVPFDTASIQLRYKDRLLIVACAGFPNPEDIYQIEFPADDPRYPNEHVINNKKTLITSSEKFESFKDDHYYAKHVNSWMGVPLISSATNECFGMISFDSSTLDAYNEIDALQANMFSKKISSFLVEVALGPAALTQATNRENLLGLLKSWADLLPSKTSKWDDDVQAAHELIDIGQKIFRTEDCSIFFLRHKFEDSLEEPVLHLIASTAVPQNCFQRHEMKVTGQQGDGLTGLAVHRNRTLNYGANKIQKSPYRANFTYHLNFLFSKSSRQVMISPLRDSKGNAIGAIKIENRMGTSSEKEFFPVEKNLFEIYASTVSLILETIRQRNYIKRLDEGAHGLRGVVHHAAIVPILELQQELKNLPNGDEINGNLNEIKHTLEYVKMSIHGILSDSEENLYLEKEGLIHAVHHYLNSLHAIPFFKDACDRIQINAHSIRDDDIPYQIQEIFFNVAKEGLLNIARHSKIEKKDDGFGELSLSEVDGTFVLSIRDNGVGFLETEDSSKQRRSFGLNDIKKQMEFKKYHSKIAIVDVFSYPQQGTLIQAKWAPLDGIQGEHGEEYELI